MENMATMCTNIYKHKFSYTKFGSVCTKVQMWNWDVRSTGDACVGWIGRRQRAPSVGLLLTLIPKISILPPTYHYCHDDIIIMILSDETMIMSHFCDNLAAISSGKTQKRACCRFCRTSLMVFGHLPQNLYRSSKESFVQGIYNLGKWAWQRREEGLKQAYYEVLILLCHKFSKWEWGW